MFLQGFSREFDIALSSEIPGSQGIPRFGESGESQSFIISISISISVGSGGACVLPERHGSAADYD
jgi:hypothetical protein